MLSSALELPRVNLKEERVCVSKGVCVCMRVWGRVKLDDLCVASLKN